MTKYIVILIGLILAGGAFLYTTQTAQAPVNATPDAQNPFGDGAEVVGSVDSPSYPDADKDEPVESGKTDADTVAQSGGTQTGETGSTGTATPGVISRAELAKHNAQSDCWIGYKGTVYDITNWLPRHPGSAGAIAPFCGTADEFAAAFNQQHGTKRDSRLEKEGVKEGSLGN